MPPSSRPLSSARVIGGAGYDVRFLDLRLPLPVAATSRVRADLVGADGARIAHYTHFSLAIRKSRRMAAFVAWNVDGTITKPTTTDAAWRLDPRVPAEFQIDNTLYEGTKFDRGHIARREDLLWGGTGVARQANDDSFCYTNATPQHERFNRLTPGLWKSLEDEIFRQVDVANLRIALIGGPIFSAADQPFRPPTAPEAFAPVLIPRQYFKVVAYRDATDGRAKSLAFRLSQESLLTDGLLSPGARLDLSRFRMYQVDVADIEAATGLRMAAFRGIDARASQRRAPGTPTPITSFADIVR